jgi:membrane protease YdiL (CAAX protease family)
LVLHFLITVLLLGIGGIVSSILFFPVIQSGELTYSSLSIMLLSVFLLTISITLSTLISVKFLDKRGFHEFGFQIGTAWWKDFKYGLLLGGGLIFMIFLIELLLGWIHVEDSFIVLSTNLPFVISILIPLIYYIAVGYYEELFSRGYQLTNLAEGLAGNRVSPTAAILVAVLISSIVFSFFHTNNPHSSLLSTINLCLAGFFLAAGYIFSGRLAMPIGLHISWNFFQGNVFGFPVSGTNTLFATFLKAKQSGPDLWTGGKFGPEGGLIGTAAILIGIGLIMYYYWHDKKRFSLFTELAQAPSSTTNNL